MVSLLEVLFWTGIGLLIYTYLGYPILLFIINKIFCEKPAKNIEGNIVYPKVSILIAAYNEEKVIRNKIENCLRFDYPPGSLDIWVASDGSSDKTNEIVKTLMAHDRRVHLLEFPRGGKSMAINKAIPFIQDDIIVFSDANTEYRHDSLKHLVRHFVDPEIGCICGRLVYKNPSEVNTGKGESFYWRYETVLKKMESRLGYVAGANGAIYAIRRELFELLPPKTINDDFMISMKIVEKGFKCIYEENAIAYEDVALDTKSEFRRHVRDGGGHYLAITQLYGLLNPCLGLRSFIYWSHRVLRWCDPFILILLFLINIVLLYNGVYKTIFILHVAFYGFAILGLIYIESKRMPFFMYVPFYFCNLNLALLLGFAKVAMGKQKMTWERTERSI